MLYCIRTLTVRARKTIHKTKTLILFTLDQTKGYIPLQTTGYLPLQTIGYIPLQTPGCIPLQSDHKLHTPSDHRLHYHIFYTFRPKATDPSRPQSTLLPILFLETKGCLPNPFNQTIGCMSLLSHIAQPIPPRVKVSKQVLARRSIGLMSH